MYVLPITSILGRLSVVLAGDTGTIRSAIAVAVATALIQGEGLKTAAGCT